MNTVNTTVFPRLGLRNVCLALFSAIGLVFLNNAFAAPQTLRQLMNELGQVQSVQSTFEEIKTMELLNEPLRSSGKLVYKAPDYLEKRVLEPQASYYIVAGDQVRVGSAQHKERQLVLFQFPALEAFIAALRGTLAGDIKTLREYYDVNFSGDTNQWTLQLVPKNDEMLLYVKKIYIYGNGNKINQIDTLETNGDHSSMTIHHTSD
ncbi:LolA-related protein [Kaarinaea lacus]